MVAVPLITVIKAVPIQGPAQPNEPPFEESGLGKNDPEGTAPELGKYPLLEQLK